MSKPEGHAIKSMNRSGILRCQCGTKFVLDLKDIREVPDEKIMDRLLDKHSDHLRSKAQEKKA